eukprot:scaffold5088_cov98-Cylindrotheca_fusiformis.AAC.8
MKRSRLSEKQEMPLPNTPSMPNNRVFDPTMFDDEWKNNPSSAIGGEEDVNLQLSTLSLIEKDMKARSEKKKEEMRIRTEMVKLLELCLHAKDEDHDLEPDRSKKTIRKLAVTLEARLYRSAISFESYSDVKTLESRTKVVLVQWKQKLLERKRRRCSLTNMKRRQLLREQLGPEMYDLAVRLVDEINQKRAALASENCAKCQRANPQLPMTPTFGEQLPIPVRSLFFQTPLVDVFEKFSLDRIRYSGHHYLEELVKQAERNLRYYEQWKLANTIVCQPARDRNQQQQCCSL